MTFRVNSNGGQRQANIQVGHENINFVQHKGTLYLNLFGGGVISNGAGVTSDDRVKHNETEVKDALASINKLQIKHYIKTIEMYDKDYNLPLNAAGEPLDASGNPLIHASQYVRETGIIAQELREIPEFKFCVDGKEYTDEIQYEYEKDADGKDVLDDDGKPLIVSEKTITVPSKLSVRYENIHSTHIAATQELSRKNDRLEAELAMIKAFLNM
jgi:hypothetical protein